MYKSPKTQVFTDWGTQFGKVRSAWGDGAIPAGHVWVAYENGCSERLFVGMGKFNHQELVGCSRELARDICRDSGQRRGRPAGV
jgi:hypothetical protein